MIVKLFDHTEIVISQEEGKKLSAVLQRSTDGYVMLHGTLVKKSAISMVKPGGHTEADTLPRVEHSHRLKRDNRTETVQRAAARAKAESIREIIAKRGLKGLKK